MSLNLVLQAVIEGFVDGILIVTDRGELVSANQLARQICQKLAADDLQLNRVPPAIWRICHSLVKNRPLFPDHRIVIDDVIETSSAYSVRIRVQWIRLDSFERPCLMVTLEDRLQTAQKIAIAEQERYGLTRREAEVWLLRQADCTYKAIAAQLHITVDTVKKHIKNIHAKRDAVHWAEE